MIPFDCLKADEYAIFVYDVYSAVIWLYTPVWCVRTAWLAFRELLLWLKNVLYLEEKSVNSDFKGVNPEKNTESSLGLILPFNVSSAKAVIRQPILLTWFVISGPPAKAAAEPMATTR